MKNRETVWIIFNFEISRMPNSRPKRHKVRREDFSATIDYVIFIIRGFPLYTYSMVSSLTPLQWLNLIFCCFIDLCFVFATHNRGLRKITINLQWLLWRKIHSYWKSCIYISIIRSKTFYFKFKSSSMNWFKTELFVCFTCSNCYII